MRQTPMFGIAWVRASALALLATLMSLSAPGSAASAGAPFVITASSGPSAGSHIIATVTRMAGKTALTLPAALVPALLPGDIVSVDFPDYRRPPARVNYHVNVAFITETAPQHWLYARSGPNDRLFANHPARHAKAHGATPSGVIHFTYGKGRNRGIPIFFIIPEDAKTRGVDGVRDYVDAHPTDFVTMSQSTNDAVDKYSFLRDFLASLGSGSIDPASSRQRIEAVAQSVGVPAATIDACYVPGAATADVTNCIQQSMNAVVYQTNFNAPTQAQFLGGIAGAANPAALAPYVASLLTVWSIFVRTGHQEYEYLPTTVTLADASAGKRGELLMGPKVPTLRPPGAFSDVLFFTIGDPQASERAPLVENAAPANGVCERTSRFSVPLHFDHTSRYVHDTALTVVPDGRPPYRIALDPRTLAAPVVDRSRFTANADGAYTVSLGGRFGFDAIAQPAQPSIRLAFPGSAAWTLTDAPHRAPVAGESLDIIAASPAAACLSRAEIQSGSAPPIALSATALDAHRVELRASLSAIPAGPAHIRLYEDDAGAARTFESSAAIAIQPQPARVDAKSAVASLGDTAVMLAGSGLERIRALLVNGSTYAKQTPSAATSACFVGPPLAGDLTIGQHVTAQLQPDDGSPGEIFPLTILAPRPVLDVPRLADPAAAHLSTELLAVTLQSAAGSMPQLPAVRIRHADGAAAAPCDALAPDPTAVTLPASAVHARSANVLDAYFRAAVLHDRAFGTLQVQVIDTASGAGSRWMNLSGSFERAPQITQIACPADANAACRLYGSDLTAIDAVRNASGTFVAPDLDCPPTDKGLACVYVPHVAHYTLRLADAGAIEPLPDALIAAVAQ